MRCGAVLLHGGLGLRIGTRSGLFALLAGHRQAAGNADDLTGDEGRVFAGEEQHGAGQVVRLAEAAEGDGLGQCA
jgi:hypothetical protein